MRSHEISLNALIIKCFITHVLNPNSKSMLLIASILLLSRYSVQYTVYYFNDFIMFYMYYYDVYIIYIIYIYMYIWYMFYVHVLFIFLRLGTK